MKIGDVISVECQPRDVVVSSLHDVRGGDIGAGEVYESLPDGSRVHLGTVRLIVGETLTLTCRSIAAPCPLQITAFEGHPMT